MIEKIQTRFASPVFGQVSKGSLYIHDSNRCSDHFCPFHNPSNHHMKDWPMLVRLDKSSLVERTCIHGTGHPDPDSLAFLDPDRSRNADRKSTRLNSSHIP